eukprot:scaffold3740_cov322-Prasinococcus_capsulatus_cf.AAC.2
MRKSPPSSGPARHHLVPDVRQELLGQDLASVLEALLPSHPDGRATLSDEVQGHFLALDDEGLFKRWAQEVDHLGVIEVVHNVFQDVLVGHKPERAEHHHDGDLAANVRDRHPDELPRAVTREHAHRARAGRPVARLHDGPHLRDV